MPCVVDGYEVKVVPFLVDYIIGMDDVFEFSEAWTQLPACNYTALYSPTFFKSTDEGTSFS